MIFISVTQSTSVIHEMLGWLGAKQIAFETWTSSYHPNNALWSELAEEVDYRMQSASSLRGGYAFAFRFFRDVDAVLFKLRWSDQFRNY